VLRRLFGPKREEVTQGWRDLHNEELMIWALHLILFTVVRWRVRFLGYVVCVRNMTAT
jgi:hypothetical protein